LHGNGGTQLFEKVFFRSVGEADQRAMKTPDRRGLKQKEELAELTQSRVDKELRGEIQPDCRRLSKK
jgi:hypothetical protein